MPCLASSVNAPCNNLVSEKAVIKTYVILLTDITPINSVQITKRKKAMIAIMKYYELY